jgi:DNA replication factor GINS
MNLEELRSVQRAERQKDSLQHLRDSFYEDVAAYVAQLKDERERAVAEAEDPFASEDVRRLTDTIESTTEIANALYERRVGKVVKHASFAAADMATDEEGMTAEERELFEDLVARIRRNRETVLTALEQGESTTGTDAEGASTTAEGASPESGGPSTTAGPAAAGGEEVSPDAVGGEATGDSRADDGAHAGTTAGDAGREESTADAGTDPADGLLADALGDAGPAAGGGEASPPAADAAESDPVAVAGAGTTDDPVPGGTSREPPERAAESTAADATGAGDLTDGDADGGADPTGERPAREAAVVRGGEGNGGASPAGARAAAGDAASAEEADLDRTTLRITADVGTVYGVDEREYDLAREDVVTLPTTNAEPLLRKDAAERID